MTDTIPSATTESDLGMKLGLQAEKSATDRLSHDTAFVPWRNKELLRHSKQPASELPATALLMLFRETSDVCGEDHRIQAALHTETFNVTSGGTYRPR